MAGMTMEGATGLAARAAHDGWWEAVTRRDAGADGAFFYGVRTTGVYCRPACPARRPRRENVDFFESAAAAERAGYRPCRRCRPQGDTLDARRAEAVASACRVIERSDEAPALDALARAAGMSRFHFHRVFKAMTGLTPRAYAAAHRARRVRSGLDGSGTITSAMYDAGFNSSGRFYASTPARLGMTPSDFRDGGTGAEIRFAVGECSLGSLLVAATRRGVCAVALGDDPDSLTRDLQDRFPRAALAADDPEFDRWVATVVGMVDSTGAGGALPLDIRGTAFQERVWRALAQIPAGTTVTYAAVARAIGAPGSTRAVARACAANHLAVAIPCHRVVRSDGSLSGYRWGVERKRTLLEREAQAGPRAQ